MLVKTMFTLTVFKIMLFKGRLVSPPAQQGTGSERVNSNLIFTKQADNIEKSTIDSLNPKEQSKPKKYSY